MKRRDFVKSGLCLGCAGALYTCSLLKNNNDNKIINDNIVTETKNIPDYLKKFMYENEQDLPKHITFDLCNMCQLNCVKCWMRENEEQIKKENGGFGYVKFKTFKDFVDKNQFIKGIDIAANGEVLLNPDLKKILKYAYKKNIEITTYAGVNLNKLSSSLAEAIVKYKVRAMVVSIDGASPETYAIYRRGGNFNKVINNIKMINYFKKKYNSEYPHLTYKFILFGHNEHEIEKAKQLAKDLNMEIKFDVNGFPEYSPVKNPEKVLKETGLKSLDNNLITQFNLYKKGEFDGFFCETMFKNPAINFNGELMGCNINWLRNFKVNVLKEGLFNALNNEKILYAKYMLSDFSVKTREDIPCSKCFAYDFLKEKNYPIKH